MNVSEIFENLLDEDNFVISTEFLMVEFIYISISFFFEVRKK